MPDPGDTDFLLFWASSNEDFFELLGHYKTEKKGICLTTDPHNADNLRKMDIVFVESQPVYDQCRALGLPTIKAFGTDTDFFRPNNEIEKDVEYFYPATFSPWKRQREIANLGDRLLCVGTTQPDGKDDYRICKEWGVKIKEGYFPVKEILNYYQRTQKMLIPAVHGSERTVLEAMSANIPLVITSDNELACSLANEKIIKVDPDPVAIREGIETAFRRIVNTRNHILKNYSEQIYAQKILEVIES
mgnify:CR=1 FL=1